jgi:hypothetical protein
MHKFFHSTLIVVILLVVTFSIRLYRFSNPLADWHSWRQVDTSGVSRSFVQNGFDLLHPTFEDISNVPSGIDNPNGYRFVEFPLYNFFQASGFILFPVFTLEEWGRLITIISSTLTTLFLYLIVRRHADGIAAFFTGFFYAVLPYNIYYGRVVLPDPSMIMAIIGAIYFFDKWVELERLVSNEKRAKSPMSMFYLILATVFTASACLLKPYALFFTLPMVFLAWDAFGKKIFLKWQLWVFAIIAIAPLIWWRIWITQYPAGIPVSDWLFNGGNIRFKGAFFYWLFADRLGRLILGYWGMALFIIGLLVNSNKAHLKRHGFFFYSFILSSLIYITVLARGNVQHDYYQILIVPSVAIFLGLGARVLAFPPKEYVHPLAGRILLVVCTAFTLGFGWFFVRDYFNINNPAIITAGQAVDQLTPHDAKIIAPLDGDTTFLYYTNRQGWPSFQNSLPELVHKGATHLILLHPQAKDLGIGNEYKIIANTQDYLLFDLRQKP